MLEHVFVINLVYGMSAFDARTAEKFDLNTGLSLPGKKGPGWKRAGIAGDLVHNLCHHTIQFKGALLT